MDFLMWKCNEALMKLHNFTINIFGKLSSCFQMLSHALLKIFKRFSIVFRYFFKTMNTSCLYLAMDLRNLLENICAYNANKKDYGVKVLPSRMNEMEEWKLKALQNSWRERTFIVLIRITLCFMLADVCLLKARRTSIGFENFSLLKTLKWLINYLILMNFEISQPFSSMHNPSIIVSHITRTTLYAA